MFGLGGILKFQLIDLLLQGLQLLGSRLFDLHAHQVPHVHSFPRKIVKYSVRIFTVLPFWCSSRLTYELSRLAHPKIENTPSVSWTPHPSQSSPPQAQLSAGACSSPVLLAFPWTHPSASSSLQIHRHPPPTRVAGSGPETSADFGTRWFRWLFHRIWATGGWGPSGSTRISLRSPVSKTHQIPPKWPQRTDSGKSRQTQIGKRSYKTTHTPSHRSPPTPSQRKYHNYPPSRTWNSAGWSSTYRPWQSSSLHQLKPWTASPGWGRMSRSSCSRWCSPSVLGRRTSAGPGSRRWSESDTAGGRWFPVRAALWGMCWRSFVRIELGWSASRLGPAWRLWWWWPASPSWWSRWRMWW